ncbi:hypothetical protein SAMN05216299_1056 [Nitrosospira sp. Nsp14]|uniref:hypothetical protein n=1 Tax=Nitrosospira sp. Nsp14 TaxID=1855333 RepID=UPI0008F27483|nr:hypothetical protein [Nitrosospira sp. Nsp14]SFH27954.1 hypothetical protein SAMN05216299_1056 [Nitrosospira sp. Nsp14]
MVGGINEAGLAVGGGNYSPGGASWHAVLWDGTRLPDLNSLLDASVANAGWVLTGANGINDKGWIVGNAYNSISHVEHAFLMTPVPEPETYALLLPG